MVLRLLLFLTGLLRATEPAPRCETGQETLGKDNHPKSSLSLLLPSSADEQRKKLRFQDKRGRRCHPHLEMGGSALWESAPPSPVMKLGLCLGSMDGKESSSMALKQKSKLEK